MSAASAAGQSLYASMVNYQVDRMSPEELGLYKAEQAKKRAQIEEDVTFAQALLARDAKKQKTAAGKVAGQVAGDAIVAKRLSGADPTQRTRAEAQAADEALTTDRRRRAFGGRMREHVPAAATAAPATAPSSGSDDEL